VPQALYAEGCVLDFLCGLRDHEDTVFQHLVGLKDWAFVATALAIYASVTTVTHVAFELLAHRRLQ